MLCVANESGKWKEMNILRAFAKHSKQTSFISKFYAYILRNGKWDVKPMKLTLGGTNRIARDENL